MRDDEDAWNLAASLYSILALVNIRIDDVVVYKIYADEDDRTNDLFVVLFGGRQLTERQIEVLKEVASLFATKSYHKFDSKEGRLYGAPPRDRGGVYTVLHNLVCTWTSCCGAIEKPEEEENGCGVWGCDKGDDDAQLEYLEQE